MSIYFASSRMMYQYSPFLSISLNKCFCCRFRCEGKHQSYFDSLDLEMATEGEYWMILKGFIQLQRDASTGRFAAQRAGGFGSYHRHADIRHATDADVKIFTEALPPPQTFIHKLMGKNDEEQPEIEQYEGIAPPSDYFLGFSSPGTQIWGRLRQAGLETQRIYALDTRKVMIKVRCPVDRLQDVAEALKLKLKTKDGECCFSTFESRAWHAIVNLVSYSICFLQVNTPLLGKI